MSETARPSARPRVDVSNLAEAVAWLREEVGRPGSPLVGVRRCDDCRTLCWPDPDSGRSRCLNAMRLAALVDTRYMVVKAGRGGEVRVLFPSAAAGRVLADGSAR